MGPSTRYTTLGVGVTGGIGSGKTEACRIFESFGLRVLYADTIARNLIDTDETIRRSVRRLFGDGIYLDSGLDRKEVAKRIFGDEELQKKLNAIVHPVVLSAIDQELRSAKEKGEEHVVMIEAALIFEAGADRMLDYTVVIDADQKHRISRVIERDHSSQGEVIQRIKAQLPVKEKARRADFIIQNNGTIEELAKTCKFICNILYRIAEGN